MKSQPPNFWQALAQRFEPDLGPLEDQYRRFYLRQDANQIRSVIPFVVAAVALYAPTDYQILGLSPMLLVLYSLRLLLIGFSLFLNFHLRQLADYRLMDRLSLLWIILLSVLTLCANLVRPSYYFYNAPIDVIAIMFGIIIVPNIFIFRVIPIIVFTIVDIGIFLLLRTTAEPAGVRAAIIALLLANVLGIQMSARFYGYRRSQFKAQTEEQAARREIERLAATDVLTQVANRRHFLQIGGQELLRFQRQAEACQHFCLLFMDIDHFKRINDTYGHAAGDLVLQRFSTLVGGQIREIDLLGRLGGEEFAVLLPDTRLEGATLVAERIREQCAQLAVETEAGVVRLTTSIGVAQAQASDQQIENILNRADSALYRAKTGGRNRVELAVSSEVNQHQPTLSPL
jgi:diguanylate cyclase (GGDEF)-like protein